MDDGYLIKFDEENVTWHWDENYTQVLYPDAVELRPVACEM